MKKIFFYIALLACFAPMTALAEDDNNDANDYNPKTVTEWFSFDIGGGLYGLGAEITIVTLRWEHVFWEIYKTGYFFGGPAQAGGTRKGSGGHRWQAGFSSIVGYPFFLDSANRHELRLGGGFGFHVMQTGKVDFIVFEPEDSNDSPQFSGVPFAFEANYVYRISKHFALHAGFELFVPLWRYDKKYVTPSPIVFAGMRF